VSLWNMFTQAHSPYARRPMPIVPVLSAAGALLATSLCVLAVRRQRSGPVASEEDIAQLKRVLAELCRQFFHVCREVARVAKNVRAQLAKTNVAVADSTLQMQLQQQCKVMEKLAEIEAEVMGRFGTTREGVQRLQKQAGRDAEVKAYDEGMKEMLSDALSGLQPVLPNMKIPEELTEEKVLDMQRQMQILECQKVVEKMGSKRCSAKDFEKMLVLVQKESMEEVFQEHGLLKAGGSEIYHSAEAMYLRMPDFERDRAKLDAQHQQNMAAALSAAAARGEKP